MSGVEDSCEAAVLDATCSSELLATTAAGGVDSVVDDAMNETKDEVKAEL